MSTDAASAVDLMDAAQLARFASPDAEAGFGALGTERGNLPLEQLDLRADITGLAARMEFAQTFRNPFDEALEATYIFPLPDRAAVTALRMEADGRVIEAVLKERGQARADYDQAVAEGRRATIAEQERSDVFTLRVGNIMPRERVLVRLSLAGLLPFEDGAATFRFPLVVAPRYIPGAALPGPQVGDGVASDTDAVPDASRITPPILLPGFPNPVRLSAQVHVNPPAGVMPALRSSLYSTVTLTPDVRSGHWMQAVLTSGQRVDRDFVLRLDYGRQDVVTTALAVHYDGVHEETRVDGHEGSAAPAGTFVLTLMPPSATGQVRPKDVTLLLDRSGSMAGWKIVAARRAAARIVDSLGPDDRFAVWTFDHAIQRPDTLPPGLVPASDRHRFRAVEHLAAVSDGGGTEMLAPLSEAVDLLAAQAPGGHGRDRVLVLVTDGQGGNEDQILRALGPRLDGIRIHTVGVDTAVHEGFLRSLAALGGGRCELVESEDRLDEAMRAIHHRIATPLVTDLRIESHDIPLDAATVAPARLPDLFAGAPIVIAGRTKPGARAAGSITVTGRRVDGTAWRQVVTLAPSDNTALPAIWARTRIRDLEDRYAIERGLLPELEREITDISLRFKVLSRFTAFVAMDDRVVNEGGTMHRIVQPVEMPHGWDMFKRRPPTGVGLTTAAMVRAPMRAPSPRPAASLPAPAQDLGQLGGRSRGLRQEEFAQFTAAAADVPDRASEPLRSVVPESVRTFAARARNQLRQAADGEFRTRCQVLATLGTDIEQHIDRFAADGLAEPWLRVLRELAVAISQGPLDDARLRDLWARFTSVLDALADGQQQPEIEQKPRRSAAFWKR